MAFLIKQIFAFIIFLLLLDIIGGVKMKSIFVDVISKGKPILINTDQIIAIVPSEQDSFWIWLADGRNPVEITKEQNDKLLELIKVIKL